ncbi:MAG: low-complexity tail membrane protein [Thainema sp.]
MQSFRLDPYLWIHLAGLAALPILLEVCLLGLAVGYPLLPPVLEVAILAAIGIAPILWMQWTRPFYIFSLMAVALQPEKLSDQQRQMLRFFKTPVAKAFTLIAPVILIWVLWQLYKLAPIAADFTPISSQLRIVGLLVAAIAFLACNLFLQVPLSVLHVLLVSPQSVENAEAYSIAEIPQNFTLIGLRIPKILPELKAEPKTAPVDVPRRDEEQEEQEEGLVEPESADVWEEDTIVEDEGEGAIADLSDSQLTEFERTASESVDREEVSSASDASEELDETAGETDEVYTAVDESIQVTDQAVEETITEVELDATDELEDEASDAEAASEREQAPELSVSEADIAEAAEAADAESESSPPATAANEDEATEDKIAEDDDTNTAEPETATDINEDDKD